METVHQIVRAKICFTSLHNIVLFDTRRGTPASMKRYSLS
jgi:hypothetical protein